MRNKAKQVLERLKKELKNKTEALDKERKLNLSAWDSYGSELCASQLESREQELGLEVERVREKMLIIMKYISGKLDPAEERALEKMAKAVDNEVKELDEKMKELDEERKNIQLKLQEFSMFRSLMAARKK